MKDKFSVISGDLLTASRGFIIHGCNDKGVMGSGVAAGVKARFPGAHVVYQEAHNAKELTIGTCTFYMARNDLWIVNAVTQTLGVPHPLSLEGLEKCFYNTLNFMAAFEVSRGLPIGTLPLLFPKIGSARGGGDWNQITAVINEVLESAETVYRAARQAVLYTVAVEPLDCR